MASNRASQEKYRRRGGRSGLFSGVLMKDKELQEGAYQGSSWFTFGVQVVCFRTHDGPTDEKALWYAQLPWATYLLICQGGYNQEAAQLHSCHSHQQVDVRNDDLGIGGPSCLPKS